LLKAVEEIDPMVRVHALRIIGERKEPGEVLLQSARRELRDIDAFAQLAATDALGRHPHAENLRPLLELRHRVPADDTHLLHTVPMAIGDQLRAGEMWAKLPQPLTDADARALADIAPGVPSAAAGTYLAQYLPKHLESPETLARYVKHVARYAPEAQQSAIVVFARGNKSGDLRFQANLLRAMQQGTQERGGQLTGRARGGGGRAGS